MHFEFAGSPDFVQTHWLQGLVWSQELWSETTDKKKMERRQEGEKKNTSSQKLVSHI